jgi:hypothetical protein
MTEEGKNKRAADTEAGRAQRFTDSEDRKNTQFRQTYDRLTKNAADRVDAATQRLEQSIASAKTREERLSLGQQLRALEDQATAAHRAIIQQTNAAFIPDAKLKKKLLDDALAERDKTLQRIEGFRAQIRSGAAPSSGSPASGTGAAADTPPVSLLKEGQPTEFKNGQTWTLEGGKPKRVR